MSDVRRSRVLEDCKKPSNICINRQTTSHASRQCNNLSTYDNSYLRTKIDDSVIPSPVKNKIDSDRKSKKVSKSANNMNTDNRKMTGNVNIYICSENNDNNQVSLSNNPLHEIYCIKYMSRLGNILKNCFFI